jgi:hypothetical protein
MVKTLITADPKLLPWEQVTPVHNRWHPDIPAVATVEEGKAFVSELIVSCVGGIVYRYHTLLLVAGTHMTPLWVELSHR